MNFKTIDDLIESGVVIVEEQSFELDFIEDMRFISSIINVNGMRKPKFYLINENDLIVYEFPSHYGEELWNLYEIVALSFRDVDNDGDKDIIVICDYTTGVG